jgi:parallel beta-helix repeat protein
MKKKYLIIIGAFVELSVTSQAVVIAYDGFDSLTLGNKTNGIYKDNFHLYDAVNADVKGGTMVGLGTYNWSGNSATFKARTGGLTSGPFGTNSTGHVEWTGPGTLASRYVERQINMDPTSAVLYMSGMLRTSVLDVTGSSMLDGFAMGFTDSEAAGVYYNAAFDGLLFGFDGNGAGADLVVWGAGKREVVAANVTAETTYHVVLEVIFTAGHESVKVWLNPTADTRYEEHTVSFSGEYVDSLSDFRYATLYTRTGTGIIHFDELMLATGYRDVLRQPAPAQFWFQLTGRGTQVPVKQFGAKVNDGVDDVSAIQAAVDYAISNGISSIVFEAGTYDIVSVSKKAIKTSTCPGYEANVRRIFGPGDYNVDIFSTWGLNHVQIAGASNLTLEGAVDSEGRPATELLRRNPLENITGLPNILMFAGCDGISLKNMIFDNNPNNCTSGQVVETGPGYVVADIFEGLPRADEMACYCANAWDLSTGRLKEIPSLTYGDSPAFWRTVEGGDGRRMRIDGVDFAGAVAAGDGISWWVAHNGLQTTFAFCRNVEVENVRVKNGAGFGMYAFNCVNVIGRNVVFKPEGRQLPVTPRDAWKLAWNDGEVVMDGIHIEGVRWDGQNTHGPWFHVIQKNGPESVTVKKEGGAISILKNGSEIGFWNGADQVKRTLSSWSYDGVFSNDVYGTEHRLTLTFSEDLPGFVTTNTLASVYCWDIDRYVLKNSTFEKIAGAMSIIKNENVLIENCTFDNIKHPAVVLGTEWQEGTYPRNVVIRSCRFSASGWVKRNGVEGLLGIGDGWGAGSRMCDIRIADNVFENNDLGLDLADCRNVTVESNTFSGVTTPWRIDVSTTSNIVFRSNSIFP